MSQTGVLAHAWTLVRRETKPQSAAIMLAVLFAGCACFVSPGLRQSNLSAQVVIERPEDNGSLNVRPVSVYIDDWQILILCGGQAAAAFLALGKHVMRAQSHNPYDPNSRQDWVTGTVRFSLAAGETRRFVVDGAGEGSAYTHWEIRSE